MQAESHVCVVDVLVLDFWVAQATICPGNLARNWSSLGSELLLHPPIALAHGLH
jgi:hypothetical protein